jgi:hypothetical protein
MPIAICRKLKIPLIQHCPRALNFICLISPSSQFGNKMDSAVWEAIVKRSKEKKHMEAIPDTDALWCVKINQITICLVLFYLQLLPRLHEQATTMPRKS